MKEIKQNENDVRVDLVAANNHYGGYAAGKVGIFRQNLDMEKLSFENVDLEKINHELDLEYRINWNQNERGKQKITDLV